MTITTSDLANAAQGSWRRFLESYEPLRTQLYRYCRYLTRSPWDAEDLAQDALARAFVTLARMGGQEPANPRAWLFRIASNLWIDEKRRSQEVPTEVREPTGAPGPEPRAPREAAGTLLVTLSPQERAAVVLKDVFDFSLDEIAGTLATTPNAIKAALHRGRGKLLDPEVDAAPVAPAVLDAFCAAFNARDLEQMTALLLDTSIVELPGLVIEVGPAAAKAGIFTGTLFGCPAGPHAELPRARCEVRAHRGEAIFLWWLDDRVDTIVRVAVDGERIARLTSYYHAPEVIAEVCRELALPFTTHGYHYWSAS